MHSNVTVGDLINWSACVNVYDRAFVSFAYVIDHVHDGDVFVCLDLTTEMAFVLGPRTCGWVVRHWHEFQTRDVDRQ